MTAMTATPLCKHRSFSIPQAILYCLTLALVFVISLYAFVPSSVRQLPRGHVTHMKWRSGVVVAVASVGIAIYPRLFCEHEMYGDRSLWHRYIGLGVSLSDTNLMQILTAFLHVAVLYLGSFAVCWFRFYHYARILQMQEKHLHSSNIKLPLLVKPQYMFKSVNIRWMKSTKQSLQSFLKDETYRWAILRNLFIAPISEEVIFRACIIAPLLSSHKNNKGQSLSPRQICWIAPLFFGVAHLHHFYEQYRQLPQLERTKQAMLQLIVGLLFQFTYTTLFGAYASHLFIRTGSLIAVISVHIFCNYMGLPDVSFASHTSGLYGYRWLLWCAYVIGILLFIKGFGSSWLFPEESVLPSLFRGVV